MKKNLSSRAGEENTTSMAWSTHTSQRSIVWQRAVRSVTATSVSTVEPYDTQLVINGLLLLLLLLLLPLLLIIMDSYIAYYHENVQRALRPKEVASKKSSLRDYNMQFWKGVSIVDLNTSVLPLSRIHSGSSLHSFQPHTQKAWSP